MENWFLKQANNTPLIHSLTNRVTVSDCANGVLAAGGTPSMAENLAEVAQAQQRSDTLVINLGVLTADNLDTLIAAGQAANAAGHPVIFDPVGLGGTEFRTAATQALRQQVKLDIVRGNVSEIQAFGGLTSQTRGVDAAEADLITTANLSAGRDLAQKVAHEQQVIVVMSGPIDVVSDGHTTYTIANGDAMMPRLIGTGDVLSHVIAVWAAQQPNNWLLAAVNAVVAFDVAGELAALKTRLADGGQGTFHQRLFDELDLLTDEIRYERAKVN